MSQSPPGKPLSDADYEAIASAVAETSRGRWFLAEHARRNRHSDTKIVLEAIEKIERGLSGQTVTPQAEKKIHVDLIEMANAIARTKSEIAAIKPDGGAEGQIGIATTELDSIVETTERATSDILASAERIQEIAWTLRELGIDPSVCDMLDKHATETYTACSFQDLTGQRTRKVIEVLRFLEARIDAMIKIWRLNEIVAPSKETNTKTSLVNGPAAPGEGLIQVEVDEVLALTRNETATRPEVGKPSLSNSTRPRIAPEELKTPAPAPALAATPPVTSPAVSISTAKKNIIRGRDPIESLSPAERLALFT
jgi:chemotaxis protein CheZ